MLEQEKRNPHVHRRMLVVGIVAVGTAGVLDSFVQESSAARLRNPA
jgi:hypothetical protein